MTRDDIIQMALEAGWSGLYTTYNEPTGKADWKMVKESLTVPVTMGQIERFAALVAAAEREKVARWQIGSGYSTGHGETIEDLLVELEWQVRESEREACAKVCEEECSDPYEDFKNYEDTHTDGWMDGCNSCAAAIRARGETK